MDYLIESESELAKAMNEILIYFDDNKIIELSSLQLPNSLLQMKALVKQMQIDDWLAK